MNRTWKIMAWSSIPLAIASLVVVPVMYVSACFELPIQWEWQWQWRYVKHIAFVASIIGLRHKAIASLASLAKDFISLFL